MRVSSVLAAAIVLCAAVPCPAPAQARGAATIVAEDLRTTTGWPVAIAKDLRSASYFLMRAPSTRFRVTARGFRVDHQSLDDPLERDGRGDEVYVRGDVFELNWTSQVIAASTVRTERIGQNAPFQGGSARAGILAADESVGGFLTGDSYPASTPWAQRPMSARRGNLPMVIWEGELAQGANAIVIIPTIWEWDGNAANREEQAWDASLAPAVRGIGPRVEGIIIDSPSRWMFGNMLSLPVFDRGTRPIGSSRQLGDHSVPMQVQPIVLTYRLATELARTPGSETVVTDLGGGLSQSVEYALPRGVFWVRFVDPDGLEGAYTLYLSIEHLP